MKRKYLLVINPYKFTMQASWEDDPKQSAQGKAMKEQKK